MNNRECAIIQTHRFIVYDEKHKENILFTTSKKVHIQVWIEIVSLRPTYMHR